MKNQEMFQEIDRLLKEAISKGYLVNEFTDTEEEMVTYKVTIVNGKQVKQQVFPPVEILPRRMLTNYSLGTLSWTIYLLCGVTFVVIDDLNNAIMIGMIPLMVMFWPLIIIARVIMIPFSWLVGILTTII